MKKANFCLIIILSFFVTKLVNANTFFVDSLQPDDTGNGISWITAKKTISGAINVSSAGDTILVKYGSYTVGGGSADLILATNRKITSDDGDGNGWEDAQPDSALCIISNIGMSRIFTIQGSSVTTSTRIRGFKIQNGLAANDYPSIYTYYGGGILICDGADPVIERCWITNNRGTTAGGAMGNGGGIACYGAGTSPIIQYCRITNNIAAPNYNGTGYGGGIYCYCSGTVTIRYNIICSNTAKSNYGSWGYGGGISSYCTVCTIINNTFYSNASINVLAGSGFGSGIYSVNPAPYTTTIKNNIFSNHNIEYSDKRAIYVFSPVTVNYNCFYNNTNGNYNVTSLNELTSDPLFVDAANDDFHLSWTNFPIPDASKSPCIDAGDPASPLDPDGTRNDIGALFFDQSLNSPNNLIFYIDADSVYISWDAVSGSTSYKVYSSDNPISGFLEDITGTFDDESWTAPVPSVKRFYYVTAKY